jgi:hypothetical protein
MKALNQAAAADRAGRTAFRGMKVSQAGPAAELRVLRLQANVGHACKGPWFLMADQSQTTLVIQEAAMEMQSLPRYCGLPDSPKGWGEQDGHGKKPSMGLRDYVVLAFLILIGFPLFLSLVDHLWACHRYVESMNSVRERQMGEEIRRRF